MKNNLTDDGMATFLNRKKGKFVVKYLYARCQETKYLQTKMI